MVRVGTLWRIEAPHFVAGLVVSGGIVVEAAPILNWSIGKRWLEIKAWLSSRSYHGTPIGRVACTGRF